ncbi:MAG TPA: tyrosine-type recombinase/integrase [Methylocella sp.]|nr:tyrosine-type recombinase/integrase [Methylocella sp.]
MIDRPEQAPLDTAAFDRTPKLSARERKALASLDRTGRGNLASQKLTELHSKAGRLFAPLQAAADAISDPADVARHQNARDKAILLVLIQCAELGLPYWGWSDDDWARLIGKDQNAFVKNWTGNVYNSVRPNIAAYAYLLCGFSAFEKIGLFDRRALAERVFGREAVGSALGRILEVLMKWGYRSPIAEQRLGNVVAQMLLSNRSARLEDLDSAALQRIYDARNMGWRRNLFYSVHRVLAELGIADPIRRPGGCAPMVVEGASVEWMEWVKRWSDTSTLSLSTRRSHRSILFKIGRWLAVTHPAVTGPEDWTREICASWVGRVLRMETGEFTQRKVGVAAQIGRRIAPATMVQYLEAPRTFLRDCQEWGWCARRLNPATALRMPRNVSGMLGPKPRVIADDWWAKILWAGLNLETKDLVEGNHSYPLELTRAIALIWLFAGQRSDEIMRLRVGCIRWQKAADSGSESSICLLDIPVHKTGAAFTKPVDPLVGRAVEAWEAVRPIQPLLFDRKTGEAVNLLFAIRGQPVSKTYINRAIIPILCRKAGVSPTDVRGRITSHRARATIASQLYNAKEPMTLFELQAWLGHKSPTTTQYYAQITPNALTRAYSDAGYFARNVRTIEVLIDREAVLSGAAAAGEPWQHYDLGHGYCSYTFFEQCPHRMACARCDFYIPKQSSKAHILEAKAAVDRRLVQIPLTDGERAAIELDQRALDKLLERLLDTPTPAGSTPREIKAATYPDE